MINQEVFLATVFIGFFAIINPMGNIPVFLKLVEDYDKDSKKQIALLAVITAFMITGIFILLGDYIFQIFYISIPAFRIASGLLLAIVGIQLQNGKTAKAHAPLPISENKRKKELVSFSPLGIPVLAGPGTILLATSFTSQYQGLLNTLGILVGLALNCIICYFFFTSAEKIVEKLGKDLLNVISRIMGLIIVVMGIQIVISGGKEIIEVINMP